MKSAEELLREYRAEQARLEKEGPAERWRMPPRAITVENDPSQAVFDGNVHRSGYNATFDENTIERFRLGYLCLRCWEPQQTPFPVACSLCGYSMSELQQGDFDKEFAGTKWIGPTTSLSDEYERMIDDGKRRRHEPGSSILIPGRDF